MKEIDEEGITAIIKIIYTRTQSLLSMFDREYPGQFYGCQEMYDLANCLPLFNALKELIRHSNRCGDCNNEENK